MRLVGDVGSLKNKINLVVADLIANIFGQRVNFILRYYSHRHRIPHFKNPRDLSERILSAMMTPDFLKYADYADKVKVRNYVKAKDLEFILLNQYGTWPNANHIQWEELPQRFILKANNGSGGHIICTDKSKFDIPAAVESLNKTLRAASRLINTEPHYSKIQPMILCEELLGDGITLPIDYKFTCIRGKVVDVFLVCEREEEAKYCTLDTNWQVLPYTIPSFIPKTIPVKPENLDEMVHIAGILSSDFEFVRVDLYNFQGKIYFGELTFSPWGGIMNSYTTEAIDLLGNEFDK